MTDADLLRAKLEMETDRPVPFRRDTHLTREALFKAKVLAVLRGAHGLPVDRILIEKIGSIEP